MGPQLSAVLLQMLRRGGPVIFGARCCPYDPYVTPLCLMSCEVEWNAAMHVIIKHPVRSSVAGVPGTHEGFVTKLCDPWAGDLWSWCLCVSVNGEDGGLGV